MAYALSTYFHTIWALLMREYSVASIGKAGTLRMLLRFFRPIIVLIVLRVFIFARFRGSHAVLHVLLGFLVFHLFSRIVRSCRGVRRFDAGVFSYERVTPLAFFIAKAMFFFFLYAFLLLCCLAFVCLLWGVSLDLNYWHYALVGWFLTAFLSLGTGIFMHAVTARYRFMRVIFNFMMLPLLLLSGVIVDITRMSVTIQRISEWNPLVYAIQMVRYGFGISVQQMHLNPMYLLCFAFAASGIGLFIGRHTWKAEAQ